MKKMKTADTGQRKENEYSFVCIITLFSYRSLCLQFRNTAVTHVIHFWLLFIAAKKLHAIL